MIDLLISIYVLSLLIGLGVYMYVISKVTNEQLFAAFTLNEFGEWLVSKIGLPSCVFLVGFVFFVPIINTYFTVSMLSQLMYNDGN